MKRLTIIIAVLVAAVAAPAADASRRQLLIMQDDPRVRATPDATLSEFAELGADVVKVNLYWDELAPRRRRKPRGFDGSDPASYSWGAYDAVVRSILARGLRPYLALGNHAPAWATGRRGRRGTYRPNAKEFGRFARAAGEHFAGVEIWSIWNEPNLYSWLSPQRRKGVPLSPSIYRKLYLAAHRALRNSGHGDDTILIGELMPRGGTSSRRIRPLEFLREMVCLDRRYRQIRGKAARRRKCRRVGRIPTSGLAYHPYTQGGGPRVSEATDDAAIGQLGRVRSTLDKLARRGKLPRRLPIWITEFGFQTRPPDPFGARLKRAAGFMDESEWIAFRNPRVAAYSQYTLTDDPPKSSGGRLLRWSSWQAGLRFLDGRAKPHVYDAFELPVFIRSLGRDAVVVFGGRRTLTGGSALIESKPPGGRYRKRGSIPVGRAGYFNQVIRVRRGFRHTFRVTLDGESRIKRPVAR